MEEIAGDVISKGFDYGLFVGLAILVIVAQGVFIWLQNKRIYMLYDKIVEFGSKSTEAHRKTEEAMRVLAAEHQKESSHQELLLKLVARNLDGAD